eukprot:767144-Hanusia_phi.AAC.2
MPQSIVDIKNLRTSITSNITEVSSAKELVNANTTLSPLSALVKFRFSSILKENPESETSVNSQGDLHRFQEGDLSLAGSDPTQRLVVGTFIRTNSDTQENTLAWSKSPLS